MLPFFCGTLRWHGNAPDAISSWYPLQDTQTSDKFLFMGPSTIQVFFLMFVLRVLAAMVNMGLGMQLKQSLGYKCTL